MAKKKRQIGHRQPVTGDCWMEKVYTEKIERLLNYMYLKEIYILSMDNNVVLLKVHPQFLDNFSIYIILLRNKHHFPEVYKSRRVCMCLLAADLFDGQLEMMFL